jgi:serine/threonine-protein kinase
MKLDPGQTLLHYRLDEKIGEGGMGVVWKATDTSLNRLAAVKVLPDAFAGDPDRVSRFEREARFVASLNHPNVAGIYGTHEDSGCRFLAMEFVEGEDLAQRLSRGPIPRDEALAIAIQIARGLEAAHESGVIHRDLKPANVKLAPDGSVKVLDFGLAKVFAPDPAAAGEPSMSPTLTSAGTMAGMILGTASYMSPEQAKGQEIDRRSDIWSFGVVLFELLTGRSPFKCASVPETLAAVMMQEIDLGALPADTPGQVRRLLRRCLRRDPSKRLRDIGDARILLEEAQQAPEAEASVEATPPARTPWLPWAVAAVAIVAAVWFGLSSGPEPAPSKPMRFALSLQDGLELRTTFTLIPLDVSPDGQRVVLTGRVEEEGGLYLREMDSDEAVLLGGTEGAAQPVFSPDGQWIAFPQDGELKKISISGGPPVTLCDTPNLRGASWGTGGQIVLAPSRGSGLMLVPDSGGTPVALTELEPAETPNVTPSHRWPEFLPDGKTVLYTRTPNDNEYDIAEIVAVSVDDGTQKVLVKGGTFPKYVPTGYLVFMRRNTMFAARFSAERLELLGDPVPVLEGIEFLPTYGNASFSFSDNGVLAHLTAQESLTPSRLVWLDRQGKATPASIHERIINEGRISPDGRRVALQILDPPLRDNLWMLDLARDSLTRFTYDELIDRNPVWSPDGEWIVYGSFGGGASANLFRKRSNGTGEAERLTESPYHQDPFSISPDGKVVALTQINPDTGSDILLMRLDSGQQEPEIYLRTPFTEMNPKISRDGRWIAYASNETGRMEIYVRPFSGSGGQIKVSSDGGSWPVWSPDGTELFYGQFRDRKLMAVRYTVAGDEFLPEAAEEVLNLGQNYGLHFQVTGDPVRFLTGESLLPGGAKERPPRIVVNWFEELERKVPGP